MRQLIGILMMFLFGFIAMATFSGCSESRKENIIKSLQLDNESFMAADTAISDTSYPIQAKSICAVYDASQTHVNSTILDRYVLLAKRSDCFGTPVRRFTWLS